MNFQGLHARYRRLYQENEAWRLLRADNAPQILAFITALFAEESSVAFGRARVSLDTELQKCRELGIWETETNAATYLNQWIRAGWLREMDDHLSKTDASDIAIRFSQGLDQRTVGATASHLRIVQEAVRDFVVALSPDASERIAALEKQKNALQNEIDALNAGVITQLSETEQRERIREIYQLASVLTGDFRRVEDEIRQLDQTLRIQMIEEGATRGDVLLALMEKEALLAATDAGSAFEGFFHLLCDQNRSAELREQLRTILSKPVARQLTEQQRRFLGQLMRELAQESERVFQIRRRTEEGLRAYIESGAAYENRAINKLLGQLERIAVELNQGALPLKTETALCLGVGPIRIASPDSLKLRIPEEQINTSGIELQRNATKPNAQMLASLESVQVKQIAAQTQVLLQQHGPMSIANVVQHLPMKAGLEELVAYLRVAKAVGATRLVQKEVVEFTDRKGVHLKASIPTYFLDATLFPDNIDTLVI